jgi:hypothetical protein
MAEALLVKDQETFTSDPQMLSLFRPRVDLRCGQVAAVDQMVDGMAGDGEEVGDIADFDERRNELFFKRGTICNHGVEFMGILTRL